MSDKPLTSTKGLVHAVMYCADCKWVDEKHTTAREAGRKHALKYGHKVSGELGYALVYDGHKDRQQEAPQQGQSPEVRRK